MNTDTDKEFRDKDFYTIMNGNAPITDMLDFIHRREQEVRKEVVNEIIKVIKEKKAMHEAFPLFEVMGGTERPMDKYNKGYETALDEILSALSNTKNT